MSLTPDETERYQQQMALPQFGKIGQEKLKKARVVVVGLGGLGCALLPYLTSAGIGSLTLIDHDTISLNNLHRQTLYTDQDVGAFKAEVAASKLAGLNTHVRIYPLTTQLTSLNATSLIQNHNLIIDATDSFETRLAINDACQALHIPFLMGSVQQFEGQIALFVPPISDYKGLFGHDLNAPTCSQAGILGPFVGLIGAIQACEAIKYLADMTPNLAHHLLRIDGCTYKTERFAILKEEPEELTLQEIQQRHLPLIDIREPWERQLAHLGGSSHPMEYLLQNPHLITTASALYCQSGRRSLHAIRILRKTLGRTDIYSLKGGMSAYGT